jgi:hypothetical protein
MGAKDKMNDNNLSIEEQALHLELARKLGYDEAKQKLEQHKVEATTLSDEQCYQYLRSPSAFKLMARTLYKAGYEKAMEQL